MIVIDGLLDRLSELTVTRKPFAAIDFYFQFHRIFYIIFVI
ncbi:MAG: hypothetical protein WAZ22_00265 [Mesotoga infera]